jgi:predicted AAA+ superfamily ATPase
MTRRASAMKQLDAAVEQSGVTVVRGLPRVGRSSFLAEWQSRHTNAKRCETIDDVKVETGVFVLDHVDLSSVTGIIAIARAAEEAKSRTRLVIAPNDLVTAEHLRTKLPGVTAALEITPLSVEDLAAEARAQFAPMGPVNAVPTASMPINQDAVERDRHWLRGGFPESLKAESDKRSLTWRRTMLDGLLARDYTEWRVERAFPLANVLRWLANQNGSELDENGCPFAKRQELRSAVYVLELLGLVRRLPNFPAESSASMAEKQKVYIRDTGVLHALLGIENSSQLRSYKGIGESFESYATEALILAADGRCSAHFYRKKGREGEDEIDLVLDFPSQEGRLVAIEFKVGEGRKAKKGFYNGCIALALKDQDRFVVHSGNRSILDQPVHRLNLKSAVERITKISQGG